MPSFTFETPEMVKILISQKSKFEKTQKNIQLCQRYDYLGRQQLRTLQQFRKQMNAPSEFIPLFAVR